MWGEESSMQRQEREDRMGSGENDRRVTERMSNAFIQAYPKQDHGAHNRLYTSNQSCPIALYSASQPLMHPTKRNLARANTDNSTNQTRV